MNILMVYPNVPETFWSFKHAMRIIKRKASIPPLGLLTIAGMLPEEWDKKLIDMNVEALLDKHLHWADMVFISGMLVQKKSADEVIARCRENDVKVVAGGPLFNAYEPGHPGVDHLVLNEAEITLPLFLDDLERGCPKPIYTSGERPDITSVPVPMWDLVNFKHYANMPVQYSRGCPHDCEFCDIIIMNGRKPRTKGAAQFIAELESLRVRKWKRGVFVVDDNFVGNKRNLRVMLPQLVAWMKEHDYPFTLFTEASLDLASDDELLGMMVEANFSHVFCGIETPVAESLVACNKNQNVKCDMTEAVKKIQNAGLEVMGGFIVGFDTDPPNIFERQLAFIQQTGIVAAMIGLLNALPGTRLYKRLETEKRLVGASTGNNIDGTINFVPRMDRERLIEGYRSLIRSAYSSANIYRRIRTFLKEYRPVRHRRVCWSEVGDLFRSIWYLGILGRSRWRYWRLFFGTLVGNPKSFAVAINLAVLGYHFEIMMRDIIAQGGA